MSDEVVWNGDEYLAGVEACLKAGITWGAAVLQQQMKYNFGSQGGGVIGVSRTGRNIYEAAPEGAFPGIRSARLWRSISIQWLEPRGGGTNRMTARVGTNVLYGRYLEEGTRRMPARPWAWRSYKMSLSRIRRAIFQKYRECAR
jgi:hypothetical protein